MFIGGHRHFERSALHVLEHVASARDVVKVTPKEHQELPLTCFQGSDLRTTIWFTRRQNEEFP